MKFKLRESTKKDMDQVLNLIKELAIFEKEEKEVEIDLENLIKEGFSSKPLFKCFVAEEDKIIIGAALTYNRYSTWKGRTLHLEDLIVTKEKRGLGVGTMLLDKVVEYGIKKHVKRISWEVINWNKKAINLYLKKGGIIKKDWNIIHLNENAIKNYFNND